MGSTVRQQTVFEIRDTATFVRASLGDFGNEQDLIFARVHFIVLSTKQLTPLKQRRLRYGE